MLGKSWFVVFLLGFPLLVTGQNQGGGNQGGGNQNQNQNNAGGILIDASGVVLPGFAGELSGRLSRQKQRALAAAALEGDLLSNSQCRKVSLVQLAAEIETHLSGGRPLPLELVNLAGLQQVDYLFVDLERHDLVLAGPAEGFALDTAGRMRGVESGRPTLLLDDLLVALRTLPDQRQIGCSIDPVPERLAALGQFLSANSTPASPAMIEGRFRQMAKTLGMQTIRIDGVPGDSRFGRVLVAADLRMKRISMGLDDPQVKGLRSHLSLLKGGGNSIQRWWLVPYYEALYTDADRLAFEFVGQRLQLLSQEELADAQGQRSAAATTRLTTQAFAKLFTEHYPALANQVPVFAELQQLTDWCVIAALLQQEQLFRKIGWNGGVLLDAQRLPHQEGPIPTETTSLAAYRRVSSGLVVGLVGGGVTIRPSEITGAGTLRTDPARRLDSISDSHLQSTRSANHLWWWD